MTGKQLKNSILQLAIQGKLVPQDPHDEPASELLKRIRKEKEQLVKTGKLKKKDLESTPIAEDEKPFEIPESWEWCRLSTIVNVLGDGIHGTPSYSENGDYYFVNGNNLSHGNILIKPDTKKCTFVEFEKYKKNLDSSTMFVSINGTIGNYAFYNNEPVILGKSACYFNLSEAKLKDYLAYFVQTKYFLEYALDNATGSTIKNVSLGTMRETLIPLPPLSEQHRIVEKIEELMPLVEEYDKAQSELDKLNESLPEQLKKSILQQAIMGKLVPQDPNDEPASELLKRIHKEKENLVKSGALKKKDLITTPISDDEKPFDIPESWEWVRLGEISSFNGGFAFKSINYVEKGHGTRVLRISDFSEHGIIEKSPVYYPSDVSLIKYVLTEGDIVMCMTGGTVGKSFHVKQLTEPFYVNQRVADIKVHKAIDSDFIYMVIISSYIQSIITDSKNSTNDNISSELINGFMIPLPPLSEQHRIVAKIEELFNILK